MRRCSWWGVHFGSGGVIVNRGYSKGHERNSALGMHLSYLFWWGLQSEAPPFLLPFSQGSDDLPAEYFWFICPHIVVSYLCGLHGTWAVQVWGPLEERRDDASVMMPVTNTQYLCDSPSLVPEILRMSYKNLDTIMKANISLLIGNLSTRPIINEIADMWASNGHLSHMITTWILSKTEFPVEN